MRAVLQRVHHAECVVEGQVTGKIAVGLLVFLGVQEGDTPEDAAWISEKIVAVRLFADDEGKMNRSVLDVSGQVLLISQFTLFGNLAKGTRPSFNRAAPPEVANEFYQYVSSLIAERLGHPTQLGLFGAHMDINAHNDGPVTLLLDSRDRKL